MSHAHVSRRTLLQAFATGTLAVTAGCTQTTTPTQSQTHIAIVYPTAGTSPTTSPQNALAHTGMTRAERQLGITANHIEPASHISFEALHRKLAKHTTYDLILALGRQQQPAVETVAQAFPEQRWGLINGIAKDAHGQPLTNVTSIVFQTQYLGYLAGIVAGHLTQHDFTRQAGQTTPTTTQIGFLGNPARPAVKLAQFGYQYAIETMNDAPELQLTTVASDSTVTRRAKAARTQFTAGVDILYVPHAVSDSVFQAARDAAGYVISGPVDLSAMYPAFQGNMLGHTISQIDVAVYLIARHIRDDDFYSISGPNHLGPKQDGVSFTVNQSVSPLPNPVQTAVADAKQALMTDQIEIPIPSEIPW